VLALLLAVKLLPLLSLALASHHSRNFSGSPRALGTQLRLFALTLVLNFDVGAIDRRLMLLNHRVIDVMAMLEGDGMNETHFGDALLLEV
jgi:hypothetical protein